MTAPRPLVVDRARQLNQKLRLDQVALYSLSADPVAGVAEPHLGYAITIDSVVWLATAISIEAFYPLRVEIQHVADGAPTPLARVAVTTRVSYMREPGFVEADLEYVEDYLGIVGWMHVWPYARADVQALSARLGFPPLVLPVLLAGQTSSAVVRRQEEAADVVPATGPKPKRMTGSKSPRPPAKSKKR